MQQKKSVIRTMEQIRKEGRMSKPEFARLEGLIDGIHLLKPRPNRADYLRGVMAAIQGEMKRHNIKHNIKK